MAIETVGRPAAEVWMVAAHDWDLAGATAAGMTTAFVARPSMPYSAAYPPPTLRVTGVDDLADQLLEPVPGGQHYPGLDLGDRRLAAGRRRRRLLGAQLGLDPGQGDGEIDRLDDVVVGAVVQGRDHVVAAGLGGRHDHRQLGLGMVAAQDLEHLDAVEAGHHDVQQHQVDRLAGDDLERPLAALGDLHLKALALEAPRQHVAVHLVVVDDEEGVILVFHGDLARVLRPKWGTVYQGPTGRSKPGVNAPARSAASGRSARPRP